MNKLIKWVGIPAVVVGGIAACGVGYLLLAFPKVGPASAQTMQATPKSLKRGEYLAKHVTLCLDCHSERDWSRFSAPPKPGTEGRGGDHFTREMGFPGDFYSSNITPGGIGSWSDGELARAITTGVTREGRAMFPIMPYRYYRHLCADDLTAIVTFVRSLPKSDAKHPAPELDFPMNLIVRTIPTEADPRPCADPGSANRGEYLTTIAGCVECHTERERGEAVGKLYAGGWRFPVVSGGHITSANITPDTETGIGKWSRDQFIKSFKDRAGNGGAYSVAPGQRNTIMPWSMYGGMTSEDLGAIYDYLRTVPAVKRTNPGFDPQ